MRWWIGLIMVAMAGCGGAERRAQRAQVLRQAPSMLFVVGVTEVDPPAPRCERSLAEKVERWRALRGQIMAAGAKEDWKTTRRLAQLEEAAIDAVHVHLSATSQMGAAVSRAEACAQDRQFLAAWTRLERDTIASFKALEAYDKALEAYDAAPPGTAEEPAEPPDPAARYRTLVPLFEAIRIGPHAQDAAYIAGWLRSRMEEPAAARAHFVRVSKHDPRAAEIALRIGLIDAEAGRHEDAIESYERVLALNTESFRILARHSRARSQFALGDFDAALRTFVELAAHPTAGLESAQTAGALLASPWDGEPTTVERVWRYAPDMTEPHVRVAAETLEALLERGHYAEARRLAEAARVRYADRAELPRFLRGLYWAINQMDDRPAAMDARAKILTWLPEKWHVAHAGDHAAIRAASELIEESLDEASQRQLALDRPAARGTLRTHLARQVVERPELVKRLAQAAAPGEPAAAVLAWRRAAALGANVIPAHVRAAYERIPADDPDRARAAKAWAYFETPPGPPFARASALAAAGRSADAAEAFLAFAEANPKSKASYKALYNAAVAFESIDRVEDALKAYERLIALYPRSPLAPDGLYRIALLNERLLDPALAVVAYERLFWTWPDHERAEEAAMNVVSLRSLLGPPDALASTAQVYFKRYGRHRRAPGVRLRVGQVLLRGARAETGRRMLEALWRDRRTPARERLLAGRSLARADRADADRWTALVRFAEQTAPGIEGRDAVVAEARFWLAEAQLKAFEAALPVWRGRPMAAVLKAQLEEYARVDRAFQAVLSAKAAPWAIAALVRMGRLIEVLADRLLSAPLPPDLPAGGQEFYRKQIRQQAEPLEARAIHFWTLAIEKAGELGVEGRWIAEAKAALCRHERCAPAQRLAPVPTALTSSFVTVIDNMASTDAARRAAQVLASVNGMVDGGAVDAARAALMALAARHPTLTEAAVNLASISDRKQFDLDAVHHLRRRGLAEWWLTLAAMRRGETRTTRDPDGRLRQALAAPTPETAAATRARLLAAPRNPRALENRLRAVLHNEPALAAYLAPREWSAEALDLLAEAELRQADDAEAPEDHRHRARALLERAIKQPGGAPAESYARLAALRLRLGDARRAETLNEQALRRRPGWVVARVNLAIARHARDPAAAKVMLEAIDDPLAQLNLGLFALAAGDTVTARTHLAAYRARVQTVDAAFEGWWARAQAQP